MSPFRLPSMKKTELESLMRKAESRQQWKIWVREGELWLYAVAARPGLLTWPAFPPSSKFRMIVWSGGDKHGVVQRWLRGSIARDGHQP